MVTQPDPQFLVFIAPEHGYWTKFESDQRHCVKFLCHLLKRKLLFPNIFYSPFLADVILVTQLQWFWCGDNFMEGKRTTKISPVTWAPGWLCETKFSRSPAVCFGWITESVLGPCYLLQTSWWLRDYWAGKAVSHLPRYWPQGIMFAKLLQSSALTVFALCSFHLCTVSWQLTHLDCHRQCMLLFPNSHSKLGRNVLYHLFMLSFYMLHAFLEGLLYATTAQGSVIQQWKPDCQSPDLMEFAVLCGEKVMK